MAPPCQATTSLPGQHWTNHGDVASCKQVLGSGRFDAAQVYYNLLNPSAARSMPARWTGDDFNGLMATCTRTQTARRYVLSNPDLACAIIGLAEPAHLEEALAGQALGPLPQAALDQLDQLYATDFV
jgi:hypothetical protein